METNIAEYTEIKDILDSLGIKDEALKYFKTNLAGIKAQYLFQKASDLNDLLEGLSDKKSKGVSYWDYIETDTLLSLQKPKTYYPDEIIFITYHQNCELYFKLIIQEFERIYDWYTSEINIKNENNKAPDEEYDDVVGLKHKYIHRKVEKDNSDRAKITSSRRCTEIEVWEKSLTRIIRYYKNLIFSFNVLKEGLCSLEFQKFRLSLMPASGFQTFQFRQIEIMLTPAYNLIPPDDKKESDKNYNKQSYVDNIYTKLYWQKGSMQGDKESKLLINFTSKYGKQFKSLIKEYEGKTILDKYNELNFVDQEKIRPLLIEIENAILCWKIAHMNMVFEHIPRGQKGTGGTKPIDYLPQIQEQSKNEETVKKTEPEIKSEPASKPEFNKKFQVKYFPEFWKQHAESDHEYLTNVIKRFPLSMFEEIKGLYDKELGNTELILQEKSNNSK